MILVWSFNGEPLPFSELSFKDFIAIFLGLFVVGPIVFYLLEKIWHWMNKCVGFGGFIQ
jgi:hypothetical protein